MKMNLINQGYIFLTPDYIKDISTLLKTALSLPPYMINNRRPKIIIKAAPNQRDQGHMLKRCLFILPLLLTLYTPISLAGEAFQPPQSLGASVSELIVKTARARTFLDIRYDPKYVRLDYPGGDVDPATGVCTDVIIRSFREALGFDFQKAIHEDMRANFSQYPKNWGLKRADKNIDHRRVPNIEVFLKRRGASLPITKNSKDYRPGDIVTWRLGGRLPHIGIVSDKTSPWGTPLIIHNVGAGVVEDDLLFNTDINGHFRFRPAANMNSPKTVTRAP